MSFPAYSQYTDSGFQWLGKVPASWSSVPFGMLFRRIKRTGHGEEELLSVYRDYGVIRKSDRDDNFNNASDDLSSYQLVEPGDLAMNKMKAWQGSLGVSGIRGIVSPAYFVFSPRKHFHPPFMHHLLRSPPYAAGYMTISKGIRINQWDVDPDHLTSLPVLFPSIVEQQAIAAFLDRETAKIDALVAEQERLIALLKEKRQAVISHAVTKGLDPDAPTKDSGIEWIGKIPAHWEVSRLDRLMSFASGKAHEPFVEESGEHIYVSARFVSTQGKSLKYCTENLTPAAKGDVVMVMSDLPNGIALARAYQIPDDRSYAVNQRVCLLSDFVGDSSFFAFQLDRNPGLLRYNDGLNQTHLSNGAYCKLPLLEPPLSEQQEIAAFLQREMSFSSELELNAMQAIQLLQERKSALISAAVTGRIDVRCLVEQHEMEAA